MDEKDLVEGMREYISLLQKEGRYSSAKSYQDAMNSFIRYSGTDRIPYTYINKDTLRRYEAYLLEKGCMRNTVSTYIRRLRCIYNKAVENGEAAFIPSLFKGVFTGVESQRKKSLPLGDLNRLMTVPVKGEKLRKTQLTLCLMFQYGGMSFVDFAHLNRGNIKNGILDYNRQKTGTSMRLEVLDTAEAMYKELAGERGGGSGYLFPFLSGTKNGHEEYLEYNAALSRFNRNLKTLKEVAGIASDVTSYTIRHSFAMALKEQNVPIEMISELLGHKSIKTTQIYLRSFSLEKMTVVNKSCFENVYNYIPEVVEATWGSSLKGARTVITGCRWGVPVSHCLIVSLSYHLEGMRWGTPRLYRNVCSIFRRDVMIGNTRSFRLYCHVYTLGIRTKI